MDVAYKQHASQARRKNRSSTNLNHLSLAPLTSKLPLTDPEHLPDFVASPLQHNVSYLQGKSAPTTPRLLQSPSRTRCNSPRRRSSVPDGSAAALPKSKSTTHLSMPGARHRGRLGAAAALPPIPRRRKDEIERSDSDWVLRTGALISSETRESKGQAWLVSRASSTSLGGLRDAEEEAYERELAREKELLSRRGSRRGSLAGAEEDMFPPNGRFGSRPHSRVGTRSQVRTPQERHLQEGYFSQELAVEEHIPGPDFVGLDEKLESVQVDTSQADEATVRRLVSRRSAGVGSWMWSLFSVDENDEDSDNGDGEMTDGETESQPPRSASTLDFEAFPGITEDQVPPPKEEEGSSWQDAAWLLSVASKVLL